MESDVYKDIFYCSKNRHMFEYFPYELPKLEMLEHCPICEEPLQYVGSVDLTPDGYKGNIRLKLIHNHQELGKHFDPTTGIMVICVHPREWELKENCEYGLVMEV